MLQAYSTDSASLAATADDPAAQSLRNASLKLRDVFSFERIKDAHATPLGPQAAGRDSDKIYVHCAQHYQPTWLSQVT